GLGLGLGFGLNVTVAVVTVAPSKMTVSFARTRCRAGSRRVPTRGRLTVPLPVWPAAAGTRPLPRPPGFGVLSFFSFSPAAVPTAPLLCRLSVSVTDSVSVTEHVCPLVPAHVTGTLAVVPETVIRPTVTVGGGGGPPVVPVVPVTPVTPGPVVPVVPVGPV